MCYLVPFIELSVSHTSVLTILAITVERYYAICLPLQVKQRRKCFKKARKRKFATFTKLCQEKNIARIPLETLFLL